MKSINLFSVGASGSSKCSFVEEEAVMPCKMQDFRLSWVLVFFVMHIWMMDVDKAVLKSSVRLATEPLTEGSN